MLELLVLLGVGAFFHNLLKYDPGNPEQKIEHDRAEAQRANAYRESLKLSHPELTPEDIEWHVKHHGMQHPS